jgi:hypothetical protein
VSLERLSWATSPGSTRSSALVRARGDSVGGPVRESAFDPWAPPTSDGVIQPSTARTATARRAAVHPVRMSGASGIAAQPEESKPPDESNVGAGVDVGTGVAVGAARSGRGAGAADAGSGAIAVGGGGAGGALDEGAGALVAGTAPVSATVEVGVAAGPTLSPAGGATATGTAVTAGGAGVVARGCSS